MTANKFMYRLYASAARVPRYILSATGLTLLLVLTLLPASSAPSLPPVAMADKIAHAFAFGLVASALIYDVGRRRGAIGWRVWLFALVVMTAIGAAVELLQWLMDAGRSGDAGDLLADVAGAAFLPLLLWPLLRRAVDVARCDLSEWSGSSADLQRVSRLYMDAFPPEERRSWDALEPMLRGHKPGARLLVIRHDGRWAGFITWWRVGGMRYVEHFAVDPRLRGSGIGAEAIRRFAGKDPESVVLEVELAETGDMARRRIAFYERCGFVPHPGLDYRQPPYGPDLDEVALMLMTCGELPECGLPAVVTDLHRKVYGVGR